MSLTDITACFDLKRDAYYKHKRRADKRLQIEQKIVEIVKQRRRSLPREGVRKLIRSCEDAFAKANY